MPEEVVEYGMDKELRQKRDSKYDPGLEQTVTVWIEAVSGERRGDQTFAEWLKNGQVLCKLANAIRPAIVKKVNSSQMPFKQMENITFFMNAARELGVPESAMFGTPDLFEEKNMGSVVNCIYTLGGAIQVTCPDFAGPALGIAMTAERKDKKRVSQGLLTDQSSGFATSMEVSRPKERADYCVRPVQSSERPKAPADSTPTRPNPESEARKVLVAATPQKINLAPQASPGRVPNADCTYGLDKELEEKRAAKHDTSLEKEVTDWVEAITGQARECQTLAEWLKNGQVLCALANAIRPGIVKKVNSSQMPFKQMENITFFMNAARELGVPESAIFSTPDLYEEKNIPSVVNCMYTLGGAVQVSCPGFTGPRLGVAITVESKAKRRPSGLLTDQSAGFSTTMEVQRPENYMPRPTVAA
uniref:Calponin-homology (CH) domain-containing protein n=1 Tax=Alexandrium monilatum TaxID=311494 RepID=A0A7S4RVI9_9DINO|mmetsp:Transcript_105078/g.313910  ORF Transcript_105078/g.313910 Transcript_105078/m.313910 type:complete len:417 (-) Transcript_105078:75-1325(-)